MNRVKCEFVKMGEIGFRFSLLYTEGGLRGLWYRVEILGNRIGEKR